MMDEGSKEIIDQVLGLDREKLVEFLSKLPPRTLSYLEIIIDEYERDVLDGGIHT